MFYFKTYKIYKIYYKIFWLSWLYSNEINPKHCISLLTSLKNVLVIILLPSCKKRFFVLYELEGLNRQYLVQVFLFLEHFCQTITHKHLTVQVFLYIWFAKNIIICTEPFIVFFHFFWATKFHHVKWWHSNWSIITKWIKNYFILPWNITIVRIVLMKN